MTAAFFVLLLFILFFFAKNFRMTLFSLARSVTNRRADGGPGVFNSQNQSFANNYFRTMADVCEAFSFFRVFSGLQKNMSIRVHSC